MSRATSFASDEQSRPHETVSENSNPSRPRPRRYPSFSFRRAVSKTSSPMKEETTLPTTSESDCLVNGGKVIHVRVTLGYLKAIERMEKRKHRKHMDKSLVTAFASLATQDDCEHSNFAPSLPLTSTSSVNNVVWPKQKGRSDDTVNKSSRRLYFSTTLQRDEDDVELRNVLTREDDLSTVTGTSAWNHHEVESYSPELIKIQLGVARGKDLLQLGIATLVVDGSDVSGKQMDLPVRALLPGEDDSNTTGGMSCRSPRRRGLKRLFGRKSKDAKNSFEADPYEYQLTSNAILRIRVDVISDSTPLARTSLSGPAVWGDGVEDDNDSFASIFVMKLSGKEEGGEQEEGIEVPRGEASTATSVVQMSTNNSESIEIVDNPTGPSILSACEPLKFEEPDIIEVETQESSILPITSVDVGMNSPASRRHTEEDQSTKQIFQTSALLCGFSEAFYPPGIEADVSSLDFEDSSTIATSLYQGTRGEAWKMAARNSQRGNLSTVDERSEDNTSRYSRFSAATSKTSALRPKSRSSNSGALSIGEDTKRSLDDAKKALQYYAERTGEEYHEMLKNLDSAASGDIVSDQSIGEDTIDSVFEAKELLQSYASRIGLDVEDLLNVDLVNEWDAFTSPLSTFDTERSHDETEGTNTTKSSNKSRFSLFVDE